MVRGIPFPKRDSDKQKPPAVCIKPLAYVWLYVDHIDRETEKAFKVIMQDGSGHWIAKSQCANPSWYSVGLCNCVIAISEWLAGQIDCEVRFSSPDPPSKKVAFGEEKIKDMFSCVECGSMRICRRLPFFANIRPRCFKCGCASLVPLGDGAPVLDQ